MNKLWSLAILAVVISGCSPRVRVGDPPTVNRPAQSAVDRLGRGFVEAFNQTDPALSRGILASLVSEEMLGSGKDARLVEIFEMVRKDGGEAVYHHTEVYGDFKAMGVFVYRTGIKRWQNMQLLLVREKGELKINQFNFIAAAAEPVTLPHGTLEDATVQAWLSQYIDKLEENEALSGGYLIAKDGAILFEQYFGVQNQESGTPSTHSMVFNMASGGKMFTAVSILMLVENGTLNLHTPVLEYLPDYPHKEWADQATLHHLLSHSSGVGEYWDDAFDHVRSQVRTLDDIYPHVISKPVQFNPGDKAIYSNSGFILLGVIIEKMTGSSYYDFVEEQIFSPLGMDNSHFYAPAEDTHASIALGYEREANGSVWSRANTSGRGSSAGGVYSTARDILKFRNGLRTHALLSKKYTELLVTPKTTLSNGGKYGYGMIIEDDVGHLSHGHGGLGPGAMFNFMDYPELGYTLIMFANRGFGGYSDLMRYSQELLTVGTQ